MKDFIDKISSYNLFNYLLPGVIFSFLVDKLGVYPLLQKDIIVGVFLYYFVGLVISRFGSLIIEPLLKKIKFIVYSDYSSYVIASKTDNKIDLLLEVNNMYRTILSLLVLLALLIIFNEIQTSFPEIQSFSAYILITLLIGIFLFSYQKQTKYIVKRINVCISQNNNTDDNNG